MEYLVTGMMSGTSMDGIDLAHCRFVVINRQWNYEILAAETVPYTDSWKKLLASASGLNGRELQALHVAYGKYTGEVAHDFFLRHSICRTDLLASHGHTVFHNPAKGYTFQLGHGPAMAATAKCTVINDFRSMDVALGGQGAPLVPLGDQLLFGNYQYCLNLGGFANISFTTSGNRRIAYDICPLNFVINRLVKKSRIPLDAEHRNLSGNSKETRYLSQDTDGEIARKGKTNTALYKELNNLPFYNQSGPKSLGEEWVNQHILPLLSKYQLPVADLLNTFYHHAATQIANQPGSDPSKLLVTGGGTFNRYFMECLRKKLPGQISLEVPSKELIDFKEALIFALLGLRRLRKEINCLSSVTGASHDSSGGSIHIFSG